MIKLVAKIERRGHPSVVWTFDQGAGHVISSGGGMRTFQPSEGEEARECFGTLVLDQARRAGVFAPDEKPSEMTLDDERGIILDIIFEKGLDETLLTGYIYAELRRHFKYDIQERWEKRQKRGD